MLKLATQLVLAVVLAGCTTTNNIYTDNSYRLHFESHEDNDVNYDLDFDDAPDDGERFAVDVIQVEKQAGALGCVYYTPLDTPKPIKIDIERIKKMQSASDVNAELLKNISDLNNQMASHSKALKIHHQSWVKRCRPKK